MSAYAATLNEIKLLADLACQLDHMKNLMPPTHPAVAESAVMVEQAHHVLVRILGADEHLVYGKEEEMQP